MSGRSSPFAERRIEAPTPGEVDGRASSAPRTPRALPPPPVAGIFGKSGGRRDRPPVARAAFEAALVTPDTVQAIIER